MEIRTTDEVMENIKNFAVALQELQLRKKEIDGEIKDLKAEYKEEGVAVGLVSKILSKMKTKAKLSDSDLLEEDIITEKLEAIAEIQNNISALNL